MSEDELRDNAKKYKDLSEKETDQYKIVKYYQLSYFLKAAANTLKEIRNKK